MQPRPGSGTDQPSCCAPVGKPSAPSNAINKLLWVNQGTNAMPTSGQTNPYTLFTYDADGRLTHRERKYSSTVSRTYDFFWDGDDRLRSVKQGATSILTGSYDGSGLRTAKSDSWTGVHTYTWGPGGIVYDNNTGVTTTPGLSKRASGVDRFFHSDWLGSTRYLSDNSGNTFPSALRYDAFGGRSATGGSDPYDPTDYQFGGREGYQTEYASATEPGVGLQYLEQRYYDPAVGRFISQDPIGLGDYLYCGNNPIDAVDPSGLYSYAEWRSDFGAGLHVLGQYAVAYRQPVGAVGGLIAGGVTFDPVIGVASGAAISGYLGTKTDEPFGDVLMDMAAGGTGAGALMYVANQGSLAYQYQFGNFEEESPGLGCGGSIPASGPVPILATPGAPPTSGGMLPNIIGNEGRAATEAQILREGGRILGEEITLETPSAVRTRLDFVYETAQGELRFAESKKGLGARFTQNQQIGIPGIEAGGAIPRGLNAERAGLHVGRPLGPTPVDVFWWD